MRQTMNSRGTKPQAVTKGQKQQTKITQILPRWRMERKKYNETTKDQMLSKKEKHSHTTNFKKGGGAKL